MSKAIDYIVLALFNGRRPIRPVVAEVKILELTQRSNIFVIDQAAEPVAKIANVSRFLGHKDEPFVCLRSEEVGQLLRSLCAADQSHVMVSAFADQVSEFPIEALAIATIHIGFIDHKSHLPALVNKLAESAEVFARIVRAIDQPEWPLIALSPERFEIGTPIECNAV